MIASFFTGGMLRCIQSGIELFYRKANNKHELELQKISLKADR
ncbi:hypothetical protein [Candidatus Liberibacter sp.]|nr:hypothetical protein [Candidatus Liberibacter sp.]